MTRTADSALLVCGMTEDSSGAATAFAAALARSGGWRLVLCPLPSGGPPREQLDALAAAAARENAALAVTPRSDEPGWLDAFLDVSASAPCPLIAIPADAEPDGRGRFPRPRTEAAWA